MEDIGLEKSEAEKELCAMGTICESFADKKFKFVDSIRKLRKAVEGSLHGSVEPPRKRAKGPPGESISNHFYGNCMDLQGKLKNGRLVTIGSLATGIDIFVTRGNYELRGKLVKIVDKSGYVDIQDFRGSNLENKVCIKNAGQSTSTVNSVNVEKGEVRYTRNDGTYDVLLPIPLALMRPDPSWLKELIQQNRPMKVVTTAELIKYIAPLDKFRRFASLTLKFHVYIVPKNILFDKYCVFLQCFPFRFRNSCRICL